MKRKELFLSFGLLAFAMGLPLVARAEVPSNGWIVWQSTRKDSRTEVYLCKADGSNVTRLTTIGAYRPMWAPDGRWIAFNEEVTGAYVIRPDGTEKTFLSKGTQMFWTHDNAGLVVEEGSSYYLYDPETKEKTLLFKHSEFTQIASNAISPNGLSYDNRYLLVGSDLYRNGHTGDNGSFKAGFAAVVLDMTAKDKAYYVGNGCWPFTPPAGPYVYHICADCPTSPDVYRMKTTDLATRSSYQAEEAHADADWGHEYNPSISNDNKWMVYMASTGCHAGDQCDYEIFIHRLGAGTSERTRVTNDTEFDGYPKIYVGDFWKKEATKPRLLLTPNKLYFHVSAGKTPSSQTIKVKNSGGGTLSTVKTQIVPSVSWLDLKVTSSGSLQLLTASVQTSGLTSGSHEVQVSVTSNGAEGSPQTATITIVADNTFPKGDAGPDAQASDSSITGDTVATSSDGCSLTPHTRGVGAAPLLALPFLLLAWRRRSRRA